jgi:hypothetical protein
MVYNVTLPILSPIIEPIISMRPKELFDDTIEYSVPFTNQTNACVNYVKRQIRISVWRRDKHNGVITFSVNPDKAWMLNMNQVDIKEVTASVNKWMEKMRKSNAEYPQKVTWIYPHPLKTKVDHGNQFIVHYWCSDWGNLNLLGP